MKKTRKTSKGATIPKKTRKRAISSLKNEVWELCKQIIRKKYGNTCFTCGRSGLEGSNCHTGHFLPSSTCGAYLRFDIRNLRIQCSRCNLWGGGEGAIFYSNMVLTEGQEYVDKLLQDKNISIKADSIFYENKIKELTETLETL